MINAIPAESLKLFVIREPDTMAGHRVNSVLMLQYVDITMFRKLCRLL